MINLIYLTFNYLLSIQNTSQVEMANDFRGEGKIYIVIAIILVILIGFLILLFKLDNKTKRLEKELNSK